jgi:hypothetical protein
MSSAGQTNEGAAREASLRELEGAGGSAKVISAEDRAALNEALADQSTIALLTEAGRSSQRERQRRRRETEASAGMQSSCE